jgi:hypothetical protein
VVSSSRSGDRPPIETDVSEIENTWAAVHDALPPGLTVMRRPRPGRMLTRVVRTFERVPLAWRVGAGVAINLLAAVTFFTDLPDRLRETPVTVVVSVAVFVGTALLGTVIWQQARELAAARHRLADRTSREAAAYRLNKLIDRGSRMLETLRRQTGHGLHPLFGPKWQDDVDAWVRDAQLAVDRFFLERRSLFMSDAGLPPAPPGPDRVGAGWRDPLAAFVDRRLTRLHEYLDLVTGERPRPPGQ